MLAKRHQLKIGGTGIVGYVSQSGRPRIALDTGADAVFFNNPYLPETKSELSLPIKFANTIIGVLDVQSTQSAAFNEEDTSTLMTIANHLAILLQRSEGGAVSTAPTGGRRIPITSWEKQFGYSFRPDGSIVANATLEINPSLEKAIASGETVTVNRASKGKPPLLAVPVKFRDQVIGIIHIESSEINRNWTDDEIMLVQSISDRAALALENARLFENATRRAEQEETISRVTTQIGSSTDFDRIMQTTIQELGLALGASRSFIQIGSPSLQDEKASTE
jgi:GAF domain-containing protein